MTCQVTSAVSRNINVLQKTVMRDDKIHCKQFRSMFLFIPEQILCNITISGRVQLLFRHSVVISRLTLNVLGVKVGQPSSQRLQRALRSTVPASAHVVVSLCSGTPRAFPSQPQLCPTTLRCAQWGISPLPPSTHTPVHGAPRKDLCGISQCSHGVPGDYCLSEL